MRGSKGKHSRMMKLRPPEGYVIEPDAETVDGIVQFRLDDGYLIPVSLDGLAFAELEADEDEDEIEDVEDSATFEGAFERDVIGVA